MFTYPILCFTVTLMLMPLVGNYLLWVFNSEYVSNFEQSIYRFCRIKNRLEQNWKEYATSMLMFNFFGISILFLTLIFQHHLPLNPENLDGLNPYLSFNISISFASNTNWQSYVPEKTLTHFSQIFGLTLQNFFSAATGMSLAACLIRGLTRQKSNVIGNFHADLTRSIIYVLLPISIIVSCFNLASGMPQNLSSPKEIKTLENKSQKIYQGFVASQAAIKQVGSNGGGIFAANAAHPYENPTPFSNFLQIVAMLLIPCSITYFFGKMTGEPSQGWIIFGIMCLIMTIMFYFLLQAESTNMLGKEQRFSLPETIFWSNAATTISAGSVNSMHSSYSSLGILLLLLNMILSEVVFGGVGSGLYGALIYIIITSFISSMMVGKQPEYLGKRIAAKEIKLAIIAIFMVPMTAISLSAIAIKYGNYIEHEASQREFIGIIYSFISSSGNNGSSLPAFDSNSNLLNILTGIAIFIGRFIFAIPILAIAGNLAIKPINDSKKHVPISANIAFSIMLILLIIVIGGLTFLPLIIIGPIFEYIRFF